MFAKIKDLTVDTKKIIAIGQLVVPETRQTPEYFGISIWLVGITEPITVTYATEEERNTDHDLLIKMLGE